MPSRSTIIRVLFIPFQKYGDAHGEMLVSAMGGNAQGMAVLVVQQQERAAPQNDAQTPDQSAREKHVTVDGLTMPIDIAGQRMGLGCVFCESLWGMPKTSASSQPVHDILRQSRGPLSTFFSRGGAWRLSP
jgi:hypothetical protein